MECEAAERWPHPQLRIRQQGGAHRDRVADAARHRLGAAIQGPLDSSIEPGGHLRRACSRRWPTSGGGTMNGHGIAAIYTFEMARARRTLWQSLITPVITTTLYF